MARLTSTPMFDRDNALGASVHIELPVHFLDDVRTALREVRIERRAVGLVTAAYVDRAVEL